jgi:hypothetical protein
MMMMGVNTMWMNENGRVVSESGLVAKTSDWIGRNGGRGTAEFFLKDLLGEWCTAYSWAKSLIGSL